MKTRKITLSIFDLAGDVIYPSVTIHFLFLCYLYIQHYFGHSSHNQMSP